jgi:hypothetical protein
MVTVRWLFVNRDKFHLGAWSPLDQLSSLDAADR